MNTTLIEPAASAASGLCWPKYPSIYEINTWVWLEELRARLGPEDLPGYRAYSERTKRLVPFVR